MTKELNGHATFKYFINSVFVELLQCLFIFYVRWAKMYLQS